MQKQKRHADSVTRTSSDLLTDRLATLKAVIPEAFAEGKLDIAKLREAIGDAVEERPERYSFSWAGKRDAIRLLQMPSRATLVPVPEESIDFDTTGNIFIEGDNLEAMKMLYKSYAGRVKMIYIDPPYNTGKDFLYTDNYIDPLATYLKVTRQQDVSGNVLTTNPDTSGRYHSAWLTMMYPRLFLARQLLGNDGVVFVSIDDRECANLRLVMNEVFGEENFLTTFVWVNEGNIDNQSRFKQNHEYILAYARNEASVPAPPVVDPNIPKHSKLFRDFIDNTIVKNGPGNPVTAIRLPKGFPASFDEGIVSPKEGFWPRLSNAVQVLGGKTQDEVTVSSGWSSRDIFEEFIADGFTPVVDTKGQRTAFYLSPTGAVCCRKERLDSQSHVVTVLRGKGTVQAASGALAEMGIDFSYPKPVELLQYLVRVGCPGDGIILDFFAGSGTAAQAVLDQNHLDGRGRHFIAVQLPEPLPNPRPRLKTIADIARRRIGTVIARLKADAEGRLKTDKGDGPEDLGVRCFKLSESCFLPWSGVDDEKPDSYADQMALYADPLVKGWKAEDVIWEVAIKQGYSLSSLIERDKAANGVTVWRVVDGERGQQFRICLDDKLTMTAVNKLDLSQGELFVCRDAAIDDDVAANLALQCELRTI